MKILNLVNYFNSIIQTISSMFNHFAQELKHFLLEILNCQLDKAPYGANSATAKCKLKPGVRYSELTCFFCLPGSEVWSSEPCHPSWSPPASPPGTAPLRWAHLSVCGQSKSDPLATPSLSSTRLKKKGEKKRCDLSVQQ